MAFSGRWFKVFKLLSPRANAFWLFIQKKFTQFIEGLTALPADVRQYIDKIWLDIFPSTTRSPELWEKQWGIATPALDDETRRMNIDTLWKLSGGQDENYIETTLRNAGFDVFVHENNPPVDPDLFLSGVFVMIAGGLNAYAGREDAFAGKTGGELLVNGPILTNIPLVLAVAGATNSVAGNQLMNASYFEKLTTFDKTYLITDDPDLWPYFFFVGGPATRNAQHELETIDYAQIEPERETEFKALLLKIKPAHSWAGLIINFS